MARIHGLSLGTGVSEFIPVPFLDEWVIKRQRETMVKTVLGKRGITFEMAVPKLLVSDSRSLFSRMGSTAKGLVMKPLKKVFRTVLFWLTIRNAARTAMETYFMARFLHHPGLLAPLAPDAKNHLSAERARDLGKIFREVAEGIDLRAAKTAYRRLCELFGKSRKTTGDEISEVIEKSAPGFITEFDTMVGERLEGIEGCFR